MRLSLPKVFTRSPFVRRSKYELALDALEEANAENRRAIRTLFEVYQKHRRGLLLAEKQRLEDLAHVFELHNGSPCELGGIKFRVRSSSRPLDD